jgi:1,4-dihydroxy-2-naphthoate octaprenyltransferase
MAPHTLAPSILAILFSIVYTAVSFSGTINLLLALILFLICSLMQAAANTLNDYLDYKKGTDSKENSSEDAFDAVLIYNNISPAHVLVFAIAQLVVAALLGCYIVYISGIVPLIIGIIGAIVVIVYSAGRTPLSYLPIGEIAIGFTMGGLIPLACVYVLSGVLDWMMLIIALPLMIGIGMILATNNTCDIEKDQTAQRHTLAVMLGRNNAVSLYKLIILIWPALMLILELIFFTPGIVFGILMVCAAFPVLRAIALNPLNQASRDGAMAQIISLNIIFIAFYCLSIAMNSSIAFIV